MRRRRRRKMSRKNHERTTFLMACSTDENNLNENLLNHRTDRRHSSCARAGVQERLPHQMRPFQSVQYTTAGWKRTTGSTSLSCSHNPENSQTTRLQVLTSLPCLWSFQRMEGMLSGFQSDLSSISSEIQTLQQQSVSMNVRLKNRQAVRSHLSQLVDELVVPGAMIW